MHGKLSRKPEFPGTDNVQNGLAEVMPNSIYLVSDKGFEGR